MKTVLSENFNQQLISILLLITLHAAIVANIDTHIARSLIIAHIGIFLIWQPIWRGDQRLNWQNTLVFLVLMGLFIIWLDWWLLTGWFLLLIGLTGGRQPSTNQERNTNLVILSFLFIELLINCATNVFSVRIEPLILSITNIGLFILPILILAIPTDRHPSKHFALQVDLFGAITTALIASLLLLGSITNSYPIADQDYGIALVKTVLVIGALVLLISWLLSPRTGFSGLAELWTQSLLNIGTPFEHWISEIASLKSLADTPEDFLDRATYRLLSLPMIDGIYWSNSDSHGQHGLVTQNPVNLDSEHLSITIYISRNIGSSLLLHFGLLVHIIDHFYTAKLHEKELSRQAHMRAIYETGARVTHDIKNLLQSFQNITSILNQSDKKSQETLTLLKHHLPILTARLESALNKLQAPDKSDMHMVSVRQWWTELELDHPEEHVYYEDRSIGDSLIPAELFDTVLDNLFDNANEKSAYCNNINITLTLYCDDGNPEIRFKDNGYAIDDNVVKHLFKEPIPSNNGMGVGLLQCREFARECGYMLDLITNIDGNVTFRLYKA